MHEHSLDQSLYELLELDMHRVRAHVFNLRIDAFADGAEIPKAFTGDGIDDSPPSRWSGELPETKSFVLIMDDPDAPCGTFSHWRIWDIPVHIHSLDDSEEFQRCLA